MAPISLSEAIDGCLVKAIKSDCPASDIVVSGVSVDSSDIAPGWVFIGIPGANKHGASYVGAAKDLGAVALVTDETGLAYGQDSGLPVVIVEDPRAAAAQIANNILGESVNKLKLAAVTGTNGKTTTTYLLRAALQEAPGKAAVMGTLEIDVCDDVLIASRTTAESPVVYKALATASEAGRSAAVVEASSHALSLNRIDGLQFDCAVFTNLQHDHLDYYGDMENYFLAKAELFTPARARAGVVCVDDKWGQRLAKETQIPIQTVSVLRPTPTELRGAINHWKLIDFADDADRWGVSFVLRSPDGVEHDCFCPIPGSVNVQDAALAIVAAAQMGVPIEEAIRRVSVAASVPGRMEIVPSNEGTQPRILVDYAHTPEALEALLETIRPLVSGEVVLVFGTDGDRDESKREGLGRIAARLADKLWVTDENPRNEDPQEIRDYLLRGIKSVRPNLDDVAEVTTCRRDAVREAILSAGPGDLIAITGKGAETYQEVKGVKHAYSDIIVASETLAAQES